MERKNQEERNVSSIFSLIIHLQGELRRYQFCNIKRNVNRDGEFTFIHFRIQPLLPIQLMAGFNNTID